MSRHLRLGDNRSASCVESWRPPQLDGSAADALAIVSLYVTALRSDAELAERLLDEITSHPDGVARVVGGLVSLSSVLLALLEFSAGIEPRDALQTVGRLVAEASADEGCLTRHAAYPWRSGR